MAGDGSESGRVLAGGRRRSAPVASRGHGDPAGAARGLRRARRPDRGGLRRHRPGRPRPTMPPSCGRSRAGEGSGGAGGRGRGRRVLGGVTYVPGPGSPFAEFTDPDAAGIRMLAVADDAQGRGVGEALGRACIDRARAAGRPRWCCTRPTGCRGPPAIPAAGLRPRGPGPSTGGLRLPGRSGCAGLPASSLRRAHRSGMAPGVSRRVSPRSATPRPSSTTAPGSPASRAPGTQQLGAADARCPRRPGPRRRPRRRRGSASRAGRPTGVMPPYSMPVAATATSMEANEALLASSVRRARPFTSARVVASTMHAASWVSPARLAASTTQLAETSRPTP